MTGPIVKVEQGELRGQEINEKFFIFKGIPYAKPPIGELRFSVPVPPEKWDGIRDATKNPNVCAQFIDTGIFTGSEDCLYLNVNTPKISSDYLLPVMFVIHGGGFAFGDGTDEIKYGADYLVEKNVVVVTINYRLGVLGFLSLGRKEAPGNMGLRDQVEALKWVQKNIKGFGGDPANVTIVGSSAGGASAEYLMLSPMARGLFHKKIAMSGCSLLPWAQSEQCKDLVTKMLALKQKNIDDNDEILQYFKEMPTQDLVATFMRAMAQMQFQGGLYFGFVPIIEKPIDWEPFLDMSPYDLLSRGEFAKVPCVTGFCSREGLIMTTVMSNPRLQKLVQKKNFECYLIKFFEIDDDEIEGIAAELKDVYSSEITVDESDAFGINFFSDIDFIGGIYTSASYIAKHNPSTYLYEFSYDGQLNYIKAINNMNRKGACHADDAGYLLKNDCLSSKTLSESDELVRERLLQMWTNFAKYGVPTPEKNSVITTNWEPVGTNMSYLFIDENLTMKQKPYPERMNLFKKLYDVYYSRKKFQNSQDKISRK